MATIRFRAGKYFTEIRRKGFSPKRKSFQTKAAAKAWARRIESSMDNGSYIDTNGSGSVSIDQLVDEAIANINKFSKTGGLRVS